MPLSDILLLLVAAILGGALNSVAGGGTLISFPALLLTGMPPINANATNTAALFPAALASAAAYRREISNVDRPLVISLTITGIIGGTIGALVLLRTPQETFMWLVPWLLLTGTVLFAISDALRRWLLRRAAGGGDSRMRFFGALLLQIVIAVYIGFFGAGAGILTLGMLALLGTRGIHAMNGLKSWLGGIANGIALVTFVLAGAVRWPQAILMIAGAVVGGYGGARLAQRVPQHLVRYLVIVIGVVISTYFFLR